MPGIPEELGADVAGGGGMLTDVGLLTAAELSAPVCADAQPAATAEKTTARTSILERLVRPLGLAFPVSGCCWVFIVSSSFVVGSARPDGFR
ncbi:MAG: hypothetical protein HOW97_20475 [Catenulispora sp.]|nr:hypothetical protein [Catenulispora sp.]